MPPKRSKAKQAASAPPAKKAKIDTKKEVKTQTTASGSEEPGKTTSQAADDIQTVTVNDKAEFLCQFLVESGWKTALQAEMASDYFKQMEAEVQKEYLANPGQVFPPKELIFNALNTTALGKVKVVILGQDPYHDDGQAHGLSFSVPFGVAVPPSLKNIYKELAKDIPGFTIPNHGCLENWAKQGVLLLNAALTVRAHQPNSHAKIGWQRFTDAIISAISTNSPGCVFILWGGFAQKKDKLIDTKKHHVIKAAHPSPLSVSKFLGCQCFSATNTALEQKGLTSVDWSL